MKDILDSIEYYQQIILVSKDADTIAECQSNIDLLQVELLWAMEQGL